jgi:epoxyqueuosine reductase
MKRVATWPQLRARLIHGFDRAASPLLEVVTRPEVFGRSAWLPSLPRFFRRHYLAVRGSWPPIEREPPVQLRTVPGIWRDPVQEQAAFEQGPLHDFVGGNPVAIRFLYRHMWRSMIPVSARLQRAAKVRAAASSVKHSALASEPVDPETLSAQVKAQAERVGLSAVGIAAYDQKYEFAEFHDRKVGDRVIVCVLEQNYESTQNLPSDRAEQAALSAYGEIMELASTLVELLTSRGFRAVLSGPEGQNAMIHYAVDSGLGQLGINGQLLTPMAGSRCRLLTINTNAPLALDHPVDYGIHAICDACKACVRRCPVNAIPGKRDWHRGVLKTKLVTKKCMPIVAQASGCSICMKVCPIQKYGLPAVTDEFERSGRILGRGTEELESFVWPLDGTLYPPGKLPVIPPDVATPPGIVIHAPAGPPPEDAAVRMWS